MSIATTQVLRAARTALKQAVENWGPLQDLNLRVYGFDDDFPIGDDFEPSLGDLPGLFLQPPSLTTAWETNRHQRWPYTLNLSLWTLDWSLTKSERLVEELILAVYRSRPGEASVPYIKSATGREPSIPSVNWSYGRLNDSTGAGTQVTIATVAVVLTINRDPFTV